MKITYAAALLAAAVSAINTDELDFMNYTSKFGKVYETVEEFIHRKEIFLAKNLLIKAHNSRPSNFKLGHNKFTDWSKDEMNVMLGEKESAESNAYCKPPPEITPTNDAPASVNWVEAGMTTPVKDQGSCGSCWTFATTETVESANAIAGNGLVSLSEQQLVACVTVDEGCNGGMTYDAYTYLIDHNAYLDEDWAYTAMDSECTYNMA